MQQNPCFLKLQVSMAHPIPTEMDSWAAEPGNLCVRDGPSWFLRTLNFDNRSPDLDWQAVVQG